MGYIEGTLGEDKAGVERELAPRDYSGLQPGVRDDPDGRYQPRAFVFVSISAIF